MSAERAKQILEQLTAKQREALHLIVEHKTSKEAGQILGISPYTVDQRITAIKQKARVGSRRELTHMFAGLLRVSHRTVYQESCVHESSELDDPEAVDGLIRVTGPADSEPLDVDLNFLLGMRGGSITGVHSVREIERGKSVDIIIWFQLAAFMFVIAASGLSIFV